MGDDDHTLRIARTVPKWAVPRFDARCNGGRIGFPLIGTDRGQGSTYSGTDLNIHRDSREKTMENYHHSSQQVFDAQPFSRFLGAELVQATPDGVTLNLPVADHHKQQHGYVHGGVISYLADNSLTFAGGLALGGDALTSEFKLNFVKPAKGSRLEARAGAKSVGRRQAVCLCEIYSIEGEQEILCALAQGTIVAFGK